MVPIHKTKVLDLQVTTVTELDLGPPMEQSSCHPSDGIPLHDPASTCATYQYGPFFTHHQWQVIGGIVCVMACPTMLGHGPGVVVKAAHHRQSLHRDRSIGIIIVKFMAILDRSAIPDIED